MPRRNCQLFGTVPTVTASKHIKEYERLLEEAPQDSRLLQKLGEACQKAGDNVKAADAFARLARTYELDGYGLKAIAILKQVLVIDPSRNDVNLRLAELHQMFQLMSEAMAYARTALRTAQRTNDLATKLAASQKIVELDPTAAEPELDFKKPN